MATVQVPIYNTAGEKTGTQDLNPTVFAVTFKDPVVHQVVRAQMAVSRQSLAHTKGRSEVRGGGKKPWKQKGTGRARHGSRRSPLWVGGGITFGPTKDRNFAQSVNKKMKQQALRMVLSDKVASDKLVIIDKWVLEEPKTKRLHTILNKLPSRMKKTMLVTSLDDKSIVRASRNLAGIDSIHVGSLNVVDMLKKEYIIIPQKLIQIIEERYKA